MFVLSALDSAGRRRSPATMPGYHAGRPPRNKGMRYPADPPTVEEIVAVMRRAADDRHGWRLRAMIVVLWRPGCASKRRSRSPSPSLTRGADRFWFVMEREGGDARSAWTSGAGSTCAPGSARGPNFRSGRCSASSTAPPAGDRGQAPRSAPSSAGWPLTGVRRRFAPHQLRHAHALELAREGVPLNIIQRQLGHANLGTTSIYLQGIDPEEIIATVHTRRAPMMSASAGLQL
jgi:hypothetical protein